MPWNPFKSAPKDIELPSQTKRDPRLPKESDLSPLDQLNKSYSTFKTFRDGGTEALKGLSEAKK